MSMCVHPAGVHSVLQASWWILLLLLSQLSPCSSCAAKPNLCCQTQRALIFRRSLGQMWVPRSQASVVKGSRSSSLSCVKHMPM